MKTITQTLQANDNDIDKTVREEYGYHTAAGKIFVNTADISCLLYVQITVYNQHSGIHVQILDFFCSDLSGMAETDVISVVTGAFDDLMLSYIYPNFISADKMQETAETILDKRVWRSHLDTEAEETASATAMQEGEIKTIRQTGTTSVQYSAKSACSKPKTILSLIFGIISLSSALLGIYESIIMSRAVVPHYSLQEYGGSISMYGLGTILHGVTAFVAVIILLVCALTAAGMGIAGLILSFRAMQRNRMKLLGRIFSIIGICGGIAVLIITLVIITAL